MMTPERTPKLPDDVKRMLAAATPQQLDRLLWDIITAAPKVKEPAKYDA